MMDNEAELAGLMGHELGHVNARHTASRMTKSTLIQLATGLGTMAAGGMGGSGAADFAEILGGVGGNLLLASYSRDDERQADHLGVEYMTRADYGPQGMVGLMDMLIAQHKQQPSALEVMFSTHPMSSERQATAVQEAQGPYKGKGSVVNRERYMDSIASVRKDTETIEAIKQGDAKLRKKDFIGAERLYKNAYGITEQDYCAAVKLAEARYYKEDFKGAIRAADRAKELYPAEARGYVVSGLSRLQTEDFEGAYADMEGYDKALPGNPEVPFYKGLCKEGMNRESEAASYYQTYLNKVRQGERAQYAYARLQEWGYR
jgi:predicted Zn-dependent protease